MVKACGRTLTICTGLGVIDTILAEHASSSFYCAAAIPPTVTLAMEYITIVCHAGDQELVAHHFDPQAKSGGTLQYFCLLIS